MKNYLIGAVVFFLWGFVEADAFDTDAPLDDPILEERARELAKEIRCLVCQNQSVFDSDADLAKDLRVLVRERVAAGDSDLSVKQFLVERYGDFILLKPAGRNHSFGHQKTFPIEASSNTFFLFSNAQDK